MYLDETLSLELFQEFPFAQPCFQGELSLGSHPLLHGFFDEKPAVFLHADVVACGTFEPGHARVVFTFDAYSFKLIRSCAGF